MILRISMAMSPQVWPRNSGVQHVPFDCLTVQGFFVTVGGVYVTSPI